ncbi:hypothetical protein [Rubellicoccus peritrichatus]|uniref:General secretion pathway protein GspM n=1 Tax=Rubellicoccus peritrichatus TaxID=3080537 RepID=A0AAQ3QWI6_9BACT|nr:hypothetical protein [Puniceicoccus sp. CR14]WOO41927.1 hypothetical protein RZN69_02420 [Puniceicoccus sp. CR14]
MKRLLTAMSLRERIMLAAFITVCLMIWASGLLNRWDRVHKDLNGAKKELSLQRVWLKSLPQFEAKRDQVLAGMNSAEAYDAGELVAFIDSLARENKLNHTLSTPKTKSGKLFTRNTLSVAFRNMRLDQLLALETELRQRHPDIALDELTISVNKADQRLLNVRMDISSFEIAGANDNT